MENVNKENQELKPCPFCGGSASIWPTGIMFPNNDKGFAVTCRECNAAGHWDGDKTNAIEGWNRRALVPLELAEADFEENWIKLEVPDSIMTKGFCAGSVPCDLTGIQSGKRPVRPAEKLSDLGVGHPK